MPHSLPLPLYLCLVALANAPCLCLPWTFAYPAPLPRLPYYCLPLVGLPAPPFPPAAVWLQLLTFVQRFIPFRALIRLDLCWRSFGGGCGWLRCGMDGPSPPALPYPAPALPACLATPLPCLPLLANTTPAACHLPTPCLLNTLPATPCLAACPPLPQHGLLLRWMDYLRPLPGHLALTCPLGGRWLVVVGRYLPAAAATPFPFVTVDCRLCLALPRLGRFPPCPALAHPLAAPYPLPLPLTGILLICLPYLPDIVVTCSDW